MSLSPFYFIQESLVFFLRALQWIVLIRVLLSWFRPYPQNIFTVFIVNTAEQLLSPVREMLKKNSSMGGFIDWSPIIVFLGLQVLESVILSL